MPNATLKVLCIFGTRPEAIKMAPVIAALNEYPTQINPVICVTGQHREMLDSVLKLFSIHPHYDLNIMQKNQNLADLTANLLTQLTLVIHNEMPDWVLVQGDTTSAMVGALAAFYQRIKVGHIEAGLRTGDKFHPFPEEINRKLITTISDLHFVPTQQAKENLLLENISSSTIFITGNTVIDALLSTAGQSYSWDDNTLANTLHDKRILLVTAHRRENWGQPLQNICYAIKEITSCYKDIHVVYAVHMNPNVQQVVYSLLNDITNVTLIGPLDYLPFVHLLKRTYLLLTDSGGLQEEAPALGIPVLVLRETTERPEAIESGTARLVGTNVKNIVENIKQLLDDPQSYHKMTRSINPFGDGYASKRIVDCLLRSL